jgi:hypothetical protein
MLLCAAILDGGSVDFCRSDRHFFFSVALRADIQAAILPLSRSAAAIASWTHPGGNRMNDQFANPSKWPRY